MLLAALLALPSHAMRILILGSPGSGKTTLASLLQHSYQVPHTALDELNFDRAEGRIHVVAYEVRLLRARTLAAEEHWICEGNYLGWVEPLMSRADLIVHLQASLPLALRRVVWRHAVRSARGRNPYPGWLRLVRFCYYIVMQHLDRLDPYTAQDIPVGPASTERVLEPYEEKLLTLPARMSTDEWLHRIAMRLGSPGPDT